MGQSIQANGDRIRHMAKALFSMLMGKFTKGNGLMIKRTGKEFIFKNPEQSTLVNGKMTYNKGSESKNGYIRYFLLFIQGQMDRGMRETFMKELNKVREDMIGKINHCK